MSEGPQGGRGPCEKDPRECLPLREDIGRRWSWEEGTRKQPSQTWEPQAPGSQTCLLSDPGLQGREEGMSVVHESPSGLQRGFWFADLLRQPERTEAPQMLLERQSRVSNPGLQARRENCEKPVSQAPAGKVA